MRWYSGVRHSTFPRGLGGQDEIFRRRTRVHWCALRSRLAFQ